MTTSHIELVQQWTAGMLGVSVARRLHAARSCVILRHYTVLRSSALTIMTIVQSLQITVQQLQVVVSPWRTAAD